MCAVLPPIVQSIFARVGHIDIITAGCCKCSRSLSRFPFPPLPFPPSSSFQARGCLLHRHHGRRSLRHGALRLRRCRGTVERPLHPGGGVVVAENANAGRADCAARDGGDVLLAGGGAAVRREVADRALLREPPPVSLPSGLHSSQDASDIVADRAGCWTPSCRSATGAWTTVGTTAISSRRRSPAASRATASTRPRSPRAASPPRTSSASRGLNARRVQTPR